MTSSFRKTIPTTFYFLVSLTSFLISSTYGHFANELPEAIPAKRPGKTTHLHFYFHDIHGGKNPTVVQLIGPKNSVAFGTSYMIDCALTEEKDMNSKIVGRAQGMYANAAQNEVALLIVYNFEFVEGKYNGSSISVLGRIAVLSDVKELPIVGGSGFFRLARGYVLAHTVSFDLKTGHGIVEYNVYVQHY